MIEIQSDAFKIALDAQGRIQSIRHAGLELLASAYHPVGLWQLGLIQPVTWKDPLPDIDIPDLPYDGHERWANRLEYDADMVLDSDDCGQPEVAESPGGVSLAWTVPVPSGVTDIRVAIRGCSEGLEFDTEVTLPSNWALKWVVFPRIRGFGDPNEPDRDTLLYPINFGVLRHNPLADMTTITGQYPGSTNWCQMAAWFHRCAGVMLSVRDPDSSHTGIDAQYVEGAHPAPVRTERWHIDKGSAPWLERPPTPLPDRTAHGLQPAFQMQCRHWPAMSNSWIMPYKVTLDGLSHGWFEAAEKHRQWATRQRWCRRGPLAERSDAPAVLMDLDLWFIRYGFPPSSRSPEPAWKFRDAMLELREFFGVPFGVHWYHWHAFSWHSTYPTHEPPVEGFEDVVRELQSHGIVVMPYCQGRLLYRDRPTLEQDRAHASVEANGQPYLEMYTRDDDWPLALCANDPWSAEQWAHVADVLWNRYGVDGVYFDQITAMPPSLCYHAGHGHVPGGGNHYWQGYDQALARVQAGAGGDPNRFLSSELLADAFMDRIDLYLPFVPPLEDYVPLFSAIYGDYTCLMGRATPGPVMQDPQLMAICQGEQFLFGAQLGWMDESILRHPKAAVYLRDLVRLRARVRHVLAGGRMLAPPAVTCEPPAIDIRLPAGLCGQSRDLVLSRRPVRSTAWCGASGQQAILALNETPESVAARIALPEDWGESGARGWIMAEETEQSVQPGLILEVAVPPYAAAAFLSDSSATRR